MSRGSCIPEMARQVVYNSLLVQDRARLQLIALALAGKKMASGGFEKVIKTVNRQRFATRSLAPQKNSGLAPDGHFAKDCTCFKGPGHTTT